MRKIGMDDSLGMPLSLLREVAASAPSPILARAEVERAGRTGWLVALEHRFGLAEPMARTLAVLRCGMSRVSL